MPGVVIIIIVSIIIPITIVIINITIIIINTIIVITIIIVVGVDLVHSFIKRILNVNWFFRVRFYSGILSVFCGM